MSRKRQPWGSVLALPSGRFQARYRVDGELRTAPRTFATKREADAFLSETRVALDRGSWIDPNAGKVSLRDYATRWLIERTQLRPRTRELYEGLLRLHRGTRIPVSSILGYLASGMTNDEILADFPQLALEDLRAALATRCTGVDPLAARCWHRSVKALR